MVRRLIWSEEELFDIVSFSRKRILDLGCGFGYFTYLLAKKFPSSYVVGLDVNKSKIQNARQKFKLNNLDFFVGDACNFKLNNLFDIIIAIDLFHHIPLANHPKVLRMIKKYLKKNGIFILKDIEGKGIFGVLNNLHDIIINSTFPHYRSISDWKNFLTNYNFKIDKILFLPKFIYAHLYIFSRKV